MLGKLKKKLVFCLEGKVSLLGAQRDVLNAVTGGRAARGGHGRPCCVSTSGLKRRERVADLFWSVQKYFADVFEIERLLKSYSSKGFGNNLTFCSFFGRASHNLPCFTEVTARCQVNLKVLRLGTDHMCSYILK